MTRSYERGFLPNDDQELLLDAALAEGEAGLAAWSQWKARTPFHEEYLDLASFRLLPLVYRNLAARHSEDEYLTTLKGVYLQAWTKNQLLFRQLETVLPAFSKAGIPTLLLKGAALAETHYRDRGARPMADLDVAVPLDQARRAVTLLIDSGWRVGTTSSLEFDLRFRHGCPFKNGAAEIDLHWHVLTETCRGDFDAALWAEARPTRVGGSTTAVLSPTDTLFHVVVHGTRWNPVPPLRWVADGITVLRSSAGEIDWVRLVELAAEARLAARVELALRYLGERFAAPIPPDALNRLRDTRKGAVERIELRHAAAAGSWSGVNASALVMALAHCSRATQGAPPARRAAYLSSYMRHRLRGKRVASRLLRRALAMSDD
jgi:GNAT superfamily N-acetyltransferase